MHICANHLPIAWDFVNAERPRQFKVRDEKLLFCMVGVYGPSACPWAHLWWTVPCLMAWYVCLGMRSVA